MKKSIWGSLLIIILAAAAITGGTLAWFTSEAVIGDNIFTAGTLKIAAGETFVDDGKVENWNPGDCTDKTVTVEVTGTKRAFLRMQFNDGWYKLVGKDWKPWSPEADVIKMKVNGVEFPTADWTKIGDWYYYAGENAPGSKITVITKVCLDGSAGNEFQGKQYRLGFTFEAIQVTNEAVNDAWGVYWDNDNGWQEVTEGPN